MKLRIALLLSWITSVVSLVAGDVSVKISDVHLCCDKCVKGAEKAISSVPGATPTSDKAAGSITITAADTATLQKAADALIAGGYFGTSSDPEVKLEAKAGAKKGKVQSLKITGVHLCCDKCVARVNEAVTKVNGVKATTAAKGVESFEVTGDFKSKAVFTALHKAGLSGKASN